MGFFSWKKSSFSWNKKSSFSWNKPSYDYKKAYETKADCKPEELKKVSFKSFDLKAKFGWGIDLKKADCKPLEIKAIDCKPLDIKSSIAAKIDCKPLDIKKFDCAPKIELKKLKAFDCAPKDVDLKVIDCKPVGVTEADCKPFSFFSFKGFSCSHDCKIKFDDCDPKPVECAIVETGVISGVVFQDINEDGINGEKVASGAVTETVTRTVTETIEAEDMHMDGFKAAYGKGASDKKLAKVKCLGDDDARLSTEFTGESATYNVTLHVQDECDGESTIGLYINDVFVQDVVLDQNDDGRGSNHGRFSTFTIEGVEINAGDEIELRADSHRGEFVRIDKITLETTIEEEVVVTPATEAYQAEPVAEGVTVNLLDLDGVVVATTETDANGAYSFDAIADGDYRVEFIAPDGSAITLQDQGDDDTIDSDADAAGLSGVVTVSGGALAIDAGLVDAAITPPAPTPPAPTPPAPTPPTAPLTGTLEGTLFNDANENGIQDAGEEGVAGQTVGLTGFDGLRTTKTDANGNYSFDDIATGDYRVTFTEKDGYAFTTEGDAADIDVDGDSDASQTSGTTDLFSIGEGETVVTIDAGLVDARTASIGDTVFFDANENGVRDAGEAGVAGASVMLFDAAGMMVATTATDANGGYVFENLKGGDYKITFDTVEGMGFTTEGGAADKAVDGDSDADAATGMTETFTVEAGETVTSIDAGLVDLATASIGNKVFLDANGNGVQDAGEAGVAGVTVILTDAAGNETVGETDADGNYLFSNLKGGNYTVTFEEVNGLVFTTEGDADDKAVDGDSDADAATGQTDVISLKIGEAVTSIDAGLTDPMTAAITGRYFRDLNENAIKNPFDLGVNGGRVELLDAAGNPVLDDNGDAIFTLTDFFGNYAFTDLAAGTYGVRFIAVKDAPFVQANQGGNDARDSDAVPADDQASATIASITIAIGETSDNNDAGVIDPINIKPLALDNAGMTRADEALTLDVLANDVDLEGDVTIVSVGGQPIAEGETVTVEGVSVTLVGGELVIDGSARFAELAAGEDRDFDLEYTIEDEGGLTDTATATVTFKGVYETREELSADLADDDISWEIFDTNNPAGRSDDAYTVTLLETGNPNLDGTVYEEAYCLDILLDDGSPRVTLEGGMNIVDDNTFGDRGNFDGDKIDNMLEYLVNKDWSAEGYTDAEVQGAVWSLMNDTVFVSPNAGTSENALEIFEDVVANGQDFEAMEGDNVAVILNPEDQSYQPFLIGVAWEEVIC